MQKPRSRKWAEDRVHSTKWPESKRGRARAYVCRTGPGRGGDVQQGRPWEGLSTEDIPGPVRVQEEPRRITYSLCCCGPDPQHPFCLLTQLSIQVPFLSLANIFSLPFPCPPQPTDQSQGPQLSGLQGRSCYSEQEGKEAPPPLSVESRRWVNTG